MFTPPLIYWKIIKFGCAQKIFYWGNKRQFLRFRYKIDFAHTRII